MLRILIIGLIIYVIVALWRRLAIKSPQRTGKTPAMTAGEMIECARCGTFVLRNEALAKGGKFYCNKSCLGT